MKVNLNHFYGRLFKKRYSKHQQMLLDLYEKGMVLQVDKDVDNKEVLQNAKEV